MGASKTYHAFGQKHHGKSTAIGDPIPLARLTISERRIPEARIDTPTSSAARSKKRQEILTCVLLAFVRHGSLRVFEIDPGTVTLKG